MPSYKRQSKLATRMLQRQYTKKKRKVVPRVHIAEVHAMDI